MAAPEAGTGAGARVASRGGRGCSSLSGLPSWQADSQEVSSVSSLRFLPHLLFFDLLTRTRPAQTVLVIKYVLPHYPENYGVSWGIANVLQSSVFPSFASFYPIRRSSC